MTTEKAIDFEKSLKDLERLVERLEQGELGLEASLQQFERGVHLAQSCQSALQQAEHRVEMLMEKNGQLDIVSWDKQG